MKGIYIKVNYQLKTNDIFSLRYQRKAQRTERCDLIKQLTVIDFLTIEELKNKMD